MTTKIIEEVGELASIDTIIFKALDMVDELHISWSNGGIYIGGHYRGVSVRGFTPTKDFSKAVADLSYETNVGD